MMQTATDVALLTLRSLREAVRQPANDVTNVFIPIFFFAVTVGALGEIAAESFGVVDYEGFSLPIALLQGAAGIATGAGLGMTIDIQSGYFDKLLLTSTPRFAVVLGRMLADAVKATVVSVLILAVGLAWGAGFETGPAGIVLLLAATGVFALAYSGIGMAIALKTGSPQAAQAGFLIFFPLLFLAPTFAPLDIFARWLEVTATFNPVTYIIEAQRSLILHGWDTVDLLQGGASILGLGVVTFTLTALALRSRQG